MAFTKALSFSSRGKYRKSTSTYLRG